MRKKAQEKGSFWGFLPADVKKYPDVLAELSRHKEAIIVVLNVRAQLKSIKEMNEAIPWGYGDGPLNMRHEYIDRGRFHAIRLGLLEIAEPSYFDGGKGRKTRYKFSWKFVKYDKEKPGQFILQSPFINAKWKKCFTQDGKWAHPWTSERVQKCAPGLPRNNKFLGRTSKKSQSKRAESKRHENEN